MSTSEVESRAMREIVRNHLNIVMDVLDYYKHTENEKAKQICNVYEALSGVLWKLDSILDSRKIDVDRVFWSSKQSKANTKKCSFLKDMSVEMVRELYRKVAALCITEVLLLNDISDDIGDVLYNPETENSKSVVLDYFESVMPKVVKKSYLAIKKV